MPKYRKKLIEVDLPLADINRESKREKSIRHGHPSTLHLWWAPRPLASCRAVIFASMVDDPSSCTEEFPTIEDQAIERRRLHDIISRLVKWENSNDADLLAEARLEIARSIARQPGKPPLPGVDGAPPPRLNELIVQYLAEHAPTIYDPFCGGGAIPLEAQRLGMKAVGSDLNPVAVLKTKALIEIPPKFANKPPVNPDADRMGMTVGKGRKAQKVPWRGAAGLADDIRYYGRWMRDEAFKRIGHLYPTIKDENGIDRTVIAWLWARTVPCANPACGINMPLIKSFVLSRKPNNKHYLCPIIDQSNKRVSFAVQDHDNGAPNQGTIDGKGATCIVCGTTVSKKYVQNQATANLMNEQLIGIVAEGNRKRLYFEPNEEHEGTAKSATAILYPMQRITETPIVSALKYGVTKWHQLFSHRQLNALSTFSDLVDEVREKLSSENTDLEYVNAICAYLTLAVSRSASAWVKHAVWHNGRDTVSNAFGRQIIAMVWDFPEANPFSSSTQNWTGQIECVANVIDRLPSNVNNASAIQENAMTTVHVDSGPIIVTDPPYYDNISYAVLSDFFYVWLRPVLRDTYPELFAGMLTPKAEEMIADRRFDNPRQHFEDGLNQTLKLIRKRCTADYPSSIFYAYKQQEEERGGQRSTGWETMLNALIDSGFHIVGTWPMRTELTTALKRNLNALATSVILVCRPRPEDAPSVTRQQFLDELADEMPKALDQLTREGHIAPTDLAQSAIGPGMEIYSKYSSVTYISGEPFTVRDALMAINLEIQKYDERETGDLDAESQFCVTWLKQHGFDQGDYGVAETLSKAKNIDVDDLADMHDILTAENGKVQLHDIDYYHPPEHDPELPIDDRGGNMTAWEACFRIAYHMDYGRVDADEVRGAARVFNTKGRDTERIERLARILYNYHDARGEARDAYPFNAIATRWNEIFVEANRSHQETLT